MNRDFNVSMKRQKELWKETDNFLTGTTYAEAVKRIRKKFSGEELLLMLFYLGVRYGVQTTRDTMAKMHIRGY